MTMIEQARWYPSPAPLLDGESSDAYTDRIAGADGTGRRPYDHPRGRSCSIGWHGECTGWPCECPHHADTVPLDVRHMPPWLPAGADALTQLYDLPRQTGLRVMALARVAAAAGVTPDRAALTAALEQVYTSPQSQDFVTDVMSIYAAAHAGTLVKGGIPGGG